MFEQFKTYLGGPERSSPVRARQSLNAAHTEQLIYKQTHVRSAEGVQT